LAYGGMAGTAKRAAATENALLGKPWTLASVEAARSALAQDFQPFTDLRATGDYRLLVAGQLLERFFRETSGENVRLPGVLAGAAS
jgi:xanthine dehydrogenase small subunit